MPEVAEVRALTRNYRKTRICNNCFFPRVLFPKLHSSKKRRNIMSYTAIDYAKLIGMAGFSEAMLKNHFTLYQGYVTNTNKMLETLEQMLKEEKTATPEFAEL